jgi:hypothetical protein
VPSARTENFQTVTDPAPLTPGVKICKKLSAAFNAASGVRLEYKCFEERPDITGRSLPKEPQDFMKSCGFAADIPGFGVNRQRRDQPRVNRLRWRNKYARECRA